MPLDVFPFVARDVAVDVMMEELMRLEIPDMEQEISGLDVEMTK